MASGKGMCHVCVVTQTRDSVVLQPLGVGLSALPLSCV